MFFFFFFFLPVTRVACTFLFWKSFLSQQQQQRQQRNERARVVMGRKQRQPRRFVLDAATARRLGRENKRFPCRWKDCDFVAPLPRLLVDHVKEQHVRPSSDSTCYWDNCRVSQSNTGARLFFFFVLFCF